MNIPKKVFKVGLTPLRADPFMIRARAGMISAVSHDRILKEFYLRWRAAGKKPLVAMTACMRKLAILMNRLLKNPNFQLAS